MCNTRPLGVRGLGTLLLVVVVAGISGIAPGPSAASAIFAGANTGVRRWCDDRRSDSMCSPDLAVIILISQWFSELERPSALART
jgi:hypothetical protein